MPVWPAGSRRDEDPDHGTQASDLQVQVDMCRYCSTTRRTVTSNRAESEYQAFEFLPGGQAGPRAGPPGASILVNLVSVPVFPARADSDRIQAAAPAAATDAQAAAAAAQAAAAAAQAAAPVLTAQVAAPAPGG